MADPSTPTSSPAEPAAEPAAGPGAGSPHEDDSSEGGHHGAHPEMNFHVFVAPTPDDAEEFNALRPALMTVACWRLDDARYEFDSSFVLPETRRELRRLAGLRKDYPDSPMSIFGHADPVGNDDYNKKLSGRRAKAIYAVLTRNLDIWEELHNDHGWGLKSTQRILQCLGHYDGPCDGKATKDSTDAIKAFQGEHGLKDDGDAGPKTRKELYKAYMDAICVDEKSEPYKVEPAEFLGKGADPKGKADYQGCSEFNPILLFSKEEDKAYSKATDKKARDAANAPNRRVTLFFFRPGVQIDVKKWPCPRANEGTGDCKKRFWSDSKVRLEQNDEERRLYEKTKDTFACRFYDRFARRSPCEAGYKEWIVQLMQSGPEVELKDRKPLAGVVYELTNTGMGTQRGTSDANGVVRARVKLDVTTMKLKLPTTELTLKGGELKDLDDEAADAQKQGARDRLYNLGYGPGNPRRWDDDPDVFTGAMKQFQKDHGLSESGAMDEDTKNKLREKHGS